MNLWLDKETRDEIKARMDERARRLAAEDEALPPQGDHGTDRMYRHGGCRCEACRSAASAVRRAYRQTHREQENATTRAWRERRRQSVSATGSAEAS